MHLEGRRRDRDRRREADAEGSRGDIDRRDVDEDPRPESQRLPRGNGLADGELVGGALAVRSGGPAQGGRAEPPPRARRPTASSHDPSRRSADLDAGKAALAPAQQQPAARAAGRRRRAALGVGDADVVSVGTALGHRPPRRALAGAAARSRERSTTSGTRRPGRRRRAGPRRAPRRASARRARAGRRRRRAPRDAALTRSVSSAPCTSVVTSSASARWPARRCGCSARLPLELLDLARGAEREDFR